MEALYLYADAFFINKGDYEGKWLNLTLPQIFFMIDLEQKQKKQEMLKLTNLHLLPLVGQTEQGISEIKNMLQGLETTKKVKNEMSDIDKLRSLGF